MVFFNHRLLGIAMLATQPQSASRPEPTVAGCRLGPMVASIQRTRFWLTHCIDCQKHGIRSGSCWTTYTSGPQPCLDCGQTWSARPEGSWATGGNRNLPVAGQGRQLKATSSHLDRQPANSDCLRWPMILLAGRTKFARNPDTVEDQRCKWSSTSRIEFRASDNRC